jgi:hypothetical protein
MQSAVDLQASVQSRLEAPGTVAIKFVLCLLRKLMKVLKDWSQATMKPFTLPAWQVGGAVEDSVAVETVAEAVVKAVGGSVVKAGADAVVENMVGVVVATIVEAAVLAVVVTIVDEAMVDKGAVVKADVVLVVVLVVVVLGCNGNY